MTLITRSHAFLLTHSQVSCLKLIVITIVIITGIITICGGGPANGGFSSYYGARNYYDPGAFANGFKGVCTVFVSAAFSFAGTELVGLVSTFPCTAQSFG